MSQTQPDYIIGFTISPELFQRAITLMKNMENTNNRRQYTDELVQVITQMTDAGLDFFFVKSLEKAGVSSLTLGAVKMGLNTAKKGVLALAAKILRGMNEQQLHEVVQYMRMIIEKSNPNVQLNS